MTSATKPGTARRSPISAYDSPRSPRMSGHEASREP
jgi:hypothetical protein